MQKMKAMKIILALSLVLAVNAFHKHEHPVVKKDVSGCRVENVCPKEVNVSKEVIPASSNDEKATGNSGLSGKNFMAGVVMM
jgi:hypothetical protein